MSSRKGTLPDDARETLRMHAARFAITVLDRRLFRRKQQSEIGRYLRPTLRAIASKEQSCSDLSRLLHRAKAESSTLPPAAGELSRYCFPPAERQSTGTPTACLLLSNTSS